MNTLGRHHGSSLHEPGLEKLINIRAFKGENGGNRQRNNPLST